MIRPTIVKVTDGRTQRYGLTVSNMQDSVKIQGDHISGSLKCVASYPQFGGAEATKPNHYLALEFDCPEEDATVETKIDGGSNANYVDCTADGYCVYRVKNNSQKILVKTTVGDRSVETSYSLENLKLEDPVGEIAFDFSKTDFGGFGTNDDFYDDLSLQWDGANATVTGSLKLAKANGQKRKADGNYYAFSLIDYYKDKDVTVNNGERISSVRDTDWVCKITEKTKTSGLIVKCGGTTVANFNFGSVELKQE